MSAPTRDELRDFQRFLGEKVAQGGAALSPEEVLDEWRMLHPAVDAREEEAAAIQEALDDLANGDAGIPFEDFDRDFRARRNLPPKS